MWNPIQGSLTAIKTQKQFIYGPGQDVTIIKDTKNSSAAFRYKKCHNSQAHAKS